MNIFWISVVVATIGAYLLITALLSKFKLLEKLHMSLMGPFLLLHTQRGKGSLDKAARHKRFWNVFYPVTLFLCFISMAAMIAMLLLTGYGALKAPGAIENVDPRLLLALPGINPLLPLGYGLVALIVTLVFHEFSHGIVARHQGITVKSMGLLFFVIPVGAFVEPDEKELEAAAPSQRLRVVLAGPGMNIIIGMICLLLLALLMQPVTPMFSEGVLVSNVAENAPAALAGMRAGDIIMSINGIKIVDHSSFTALMANFAPGDVVVLEVLRENAVKKLTLTLGDLGEITGLSENLGKAGMGIFLFGGLSGLIAPFKNPFSLGNLIFSIMAPFSGQLPFSQTILQYYTLPFNASAFSVCTNTLFWIYWMNILLGTFNVLPISILDGYSIFRDSLFELGKKLKIKKERNEKIANGVARAFSWFFGTLLIFIILVSLV
jgi:membrane-associated protease RseP (regulator of RpoE activity)